MNSIQISKYGNNDVVEYNVKTHKPDMKDDQVLVKVMAAGVNPVDWKIREGYLKQMIQLDFPITLGGDFSGIIEDVGTKVKNFKRGDEVFGGARAMISGTGSFAEYLTVDPKSIAKKPKKASFGEAAALPLAGISALDVIYDKLKLSKGQKILIHGGAGGIGSLAVQMAKKMGAIVTTTAGTNDIDFVKKLGADKVIDFKGEKFEDIAKDMDAVFDTVGGDTLEKSYKILKKGGILVTMAGQPNLDMAKKYGIIAISENSGMAINTENLSKLSELFDSGVVKVNIDKVFKLALAKDAIKYQESGHPKGKAVIEI